MKRLTINELNRNGPLSGLFVDLLVPKEPTNTARTENPFANLVKRSESYLDFYDNFLLVGSGCCRADLGPFGLFSVIQKHKPNTLVLYPQFDENINEGEWIAHPVLGSDSNGEFVYRFGPLLQHNGTIDVGTAGLGDVDERAVGMFDGYFLWTSDSRFGERFTRNPMKIYSRFE